MYVLVEVIYGIINFFLMFFLSYVNVVCKFLCYFFWFFFDDFKCGDIWYICNVYVYVSYGSLGRNVGV